MGDLGHDLVFGYFLTPDAAQAEAVVELARLADNLGLDLALRPRRTNRAHPAGPRRDQPAATPAGDAGARSGQPGHPQWRAGRTRPGHWGLPRWRDGNGWPTARGERSGRRARRGHRDHPRALDAGSAGNLPGRALPASRGATRPPAGPPDR